MSVEPWDRYVEVDVSETGRGIPKSRQAAIFRRFYREGKVYDKPGVGRSLYLAWEIITRQGGYMRGTSETGEGSTFLFSCLSGDWFI
ncbi:MAG: sensor histidine kinase [Lachnospiraceae bacterium]|nr:sensor histidine kinase [Lachnospiraceae bacterium]